MSIQTISFYGADGRVLRQQYVGPADGLSAVLASLPTGVQPFVGQLQPDRHRIELVTDDMGDAVPVARDYVPSAPVEDEWCTWEWDAKAWAWRPVPTLAARKRDAVAVVQREIEALEATQARPLRDVALALLFGLSVESHAVTKLQSLENSIKDLRSRRDAILDNNFNSR